MSLLIQYLVKLTISLAIVWLFYQFILRKLTFYNSNRWYLLAYTLLSFFIPFINISALIENRSNEIIQFVPTVHQYTIALEEASQCPAPIWSTSYDKWDFIAFGLITIAGVLLIRFMISYFSFLRIQRKAKLISQEGVKIYQVDKNIIPFSFGNSIFLNSSLHTEDELREIVRHEFVHVKQKHTIDIIWAELLCIFNWYNPFAWLLRRSIRQNLEFIADNKVIENGVNKKEYQYLLLKVIGNNQFSIATQFNFSSLKKRIAMMNKLKTARVHLLKFLFILPMAAVLLLAFRNYKSNTSSDKPKIYQATIIIDAETKQPLSDVQAINVNTGKTVLTNADGYFTMEIPGDQPIQVEMKYSKPGYNDYVRQSFSLEKQKSISTSLIEIVAMHKGQPGQTCPDCYASSRSQDIENGIHLNYQTVYDYYRNLLIQRADTIPDVAIPNSKGYYIDIKDNKGNCTVVVKDKNKKEVKRLLLTEWKEKADYYEGLYGKILTPEEAIIQQKIKGNNPDVTSITIKNNVATVILNNGKTEVYTLSIQNEKKAFEERCGIQEVAIATKVATEANVATTVNAVEEVRVENEATIANDFEITDKKATMHLRNGKVEEYDLTNEKEKEAFEKKYGKIIRPATTASGVYAIASVEEPVVSTTFLATPSTDVSVIGAVEEVVISGEEILVTINKKTTRDELETIKKQLKEKGMEISFNKVNYDNGLLTHVSGTITSKDAKGNFSATDFSKVIISSAKAGNRPLFKVDVVANRKVRT